MIHKKTALRLLSPKGTARAAAKVLGLTPKAISNWKTDEEGRLTQRVVIDMIIAALTRQHVIRMARGEIDPEADGPEIEVLLDLVTLPKPHPLGVE